MSQSPLPSAESAASAAKVPASVQRMIDEHRELSGRIVRASAALSDAICEERWTSHARDLLACQIAAMRTYAHVLHMRIDLSREAAS